MTSWQVVAQGQEYVALRNSNVEMLFEVSQHLFALQGDSVDVIRDKVQKAEADCWNKSANQHDYQSRVEKRTERLRQAWRQHQQQQQPQQPKAVAVAPPMNGGQGYYVPPPVQPHQQHMQAPQQPIYVPPAAPQQPQYAQAPVHTAQAYQQQPAQQQWTQQQPQLQQPQLQQPQLQQPQYAASPYASSPYTTTPTYTTTPQQSPPQQQWQNQPPQRYAQPQQQAQPQYSAQFMNGTSMGSPRQQQQQASYPTAGMNGAVPYHSPQQYQTSPTQPQQQYQTSPPQQPPYHSPPAQQPAYHQPAAPPQANGGVKRRLPDPYQQPQASPQATAYVQQQLYASPQAPTTASPDMSSQHDIKRQRTGPAPATYTGGSFLQTTHIGVPPPSQPQQPMASHPMPASTPPAALQAPPPQQQQQQSYPIQQQQPVPSSVPAARPAAPSTNARLKLSPDQCKQFFAERNFNFQEVLDGLRRAHTHAALRMDISACLTRFFKPEIKMDFKKFSDYMEKLLKESHSMGTLKTIHNVSVAVVEVCRRHPAEPPPPAPPSFPTKQSSLLAELDPMANRVIVPLPPPTAVITSGVSGSSFDSMTSAATTATTAVGRWDKLKADVTRVFTSDDHVKKASALRSVPRIMADILTTAGLPTDITIAQAAALSSPPRSSTSSSSPLPLLLRLRATVNSAMAALAQSDRDAQSSLLASLSTMADASSLLQQLKALSTSTTDTAAADTGVPPLPPPPPVRPIELMSAEACRRVTASLFAPEDHTTVSSTPVTPMAVVGGGRTGLLYEVLKELRDRRGFHAADDFIFELVVSPVAVLAATCKNRWRAELQWKGGGGDGGGGGPCFIRMAMQGAPRTAAVNQKLEDEAKMCLLRCTGRWQAKPPNHKDAKDQMKELLVSVLDELRELATRAAAADVHSVLLETDVLR